MRFSWPWSNPKTRIQPAPRRSGSRLWLEALESRELLSTWVVSSASDSGSGSLRAEIAAAQSGDTIVFAAGLNGKTITLTSGELDLTKNLTIQGPGASQLTISGNYANGGQSQRSRVFEVAQNTTVALSGLTITNGDSAASGSSSAPWDGSGGAVLNHGALTVSACTVSNSFGWGDGGGIYSDGTLSVSGSTISGNEGFYGGGICNSGTAALTSTTFSNNVAAATTGSYPFINEGGGIYNLGTMVLSGCTLSSNLSEHAGGGISNTGTLTVENSSSITGNTAPGGYIPYDVDNLSVLYLDSTSTIGTLAGNPATSLSTLIVTSAADSGSGSLRAEIAAAQSGETIAFAASLNGETITLTSGELDLTKNLTIQGPGASQLTISGNYTAPTTAHASRVFEVALNATVTLSGMTISNGDGLASGSSSASGDGEGGGILNHGILTVSACNVTHNSSYYYQGGGGGGIFSDGTLTVSGCTISTNASFYGGGIFSNGGGTVMVNNSTVSGNYAGVDGGGIYNGGGIVTISNGILSGNGAGSGGAGGGIYNVGTLSLINGSALTGNTAEQDEYGDIGGFGAAIYNGGIVTISDSTVSGNEAISGGWGGIQNSGGTVTVEDSSSIIGNGLAINDDSGTPPLYPQDVNNNGVLYQDSTSTIGTLYGNPAMLLNTGGSLAGEYLFYKGSPFDTVSDDAAIAPDKTALLPGQTATFANYSSYNLGINGIMVDLAGITGPIAAADFQIRVGNDSNPAGWSLGPAPTVMVRPGAGVAGSTRVELTWPDGAIACEWVQITVLADAGTGLAANAVFYFGNAIGQSGSSADDAQVTMADQTGAQQNPANLVTDPASITDPYDYNRDGKVDAMDQIIARAHMTDGSTALQLISLAGGGASPDGNGNSAGNSLAVGISIDSAITPNATPAGELVHLLRASPELRAPPVPPTAMPQDPTQAKPSVSRPSAPSTLLISGVKLVSLDTARFQESPNAARAVAPDEHAGQLPVPAHKRRTLDGIFAELESLLNGKLTG